jgi:hypothetical protein
LDDWYVEEHYDEVMALMQKYHRTNR